MSEEASVASAAPVATEAPAAAAPVAAPAVSAADDLSISPAPVAPPADTSPVQYDPTGDAGLDLALEYVGNLGFGPEHAAIAAAEGGDFGPLEAALKALGEKGKGFEKYLALAKQAVTGKVEAAKARLAKDQDMVHKTVGGEENWKAISAWARENAEPQEVEQVNAALKAGGIAAKAMALYLHTKFQSAAGTEIQPAPAVQASASAANGAPGGILTAREFSQQSAEMRKAHGPNFEQHPAFRQLVARRVTAQRAGH